MPDDHTDPSERAQIDPESTFSLIERARAGDEQALERLFARHLRPLQRWASGRLPRWARDLADTDDLVQDTLLKTFKRIESFEPRRVGALQAYLRNAVLNRLRDELRRKGRRPESTNLDSIDVEAADSPLEAAIGREAVDAYEKALELSKPEEREAIIARVELGYSYEEMAVMLDKPTAGCGAQDGPACARAPRRGNEAWTRSEPSFDDLAGAILDGTSVDWRQFDRPPARPSVRSSRNLRPGHASPTFIGSSARYRTRHPRETWGHLRVLEPIGSGAFGRFTVRGTTQSGSRSRAEAPACATDVGDARASSVIEEGRLLARVRHPNVVTIYGAERIGDTPRSLDGTDRWRDGRAAARAGSAVQPSEVLEIGVQICHAVSAVHGAGLLHRDIKAQNVILATTDERF